jgi:hypothetical protein
MKFIEKLLRYPLPDQLKALLEKFDGDFDASHLRALKNLADEETFTWYERRMLKRAHKMARVKLERDSALNTAMSVVLNLKEEGADPHSAWYSNPPAQISSSSPYGAMLDQHAQIVKRDLDRRIMGLPL